VADGLTEDPYALPNGVLRNLLGIDVAAALESAEADITGARLIALHGRALPGKYDLTHLRDFHRFIFGDIYNWAGALRTVDITSRMREFCTGLFSDGKTAIVTLAGIGSVVSSLVALVPGVVIR
jgi:fido (protein-threonine AMPylation protein)